MPRRISYSRARSFDECAAKYKAEYIDERRAQPEPHLIIGSLVHECCDQYVRHLREHSLPGDFQYMDVVFERVWNGDERQGLPETYREEVYELCVRARKLLVFADIQECVGSEISLAVDREWKPVDFDSPEAWIRGRIDRLDIMDDGSALVTDYKSGHRMEAIEGSYQIALYAALVESKCPTVTGIKGNLVYVRASVVKSGAIDRPAIERAKRWIEAVDRRIEKAEEKNEWPATPGIACRGCSAFRDCPARISSTRIVPPGDQESAQGLVGRLIFIEREAKEIKEAIAPWIDQNGIVDVNGVAMGYFVENRLKFDTPKVAKLLAAKGIEPLDYMRVDTVAIRRIGRKDEVLAAELTKCATDASITKLKLKAGGDSDE